MIESSLTYSVAGEHLHLLPGRALYWPRTRTLIAADVHLGKGASLRRLGVAVPSGASANDLARLTHLLLLTDANRLLLLGDLFHTQPSATEPLIAAFDDFRRRHPTLEIQIVRGNHDPLTRLPSHWDLIWRVEGEQEGPFVWRHTPEPDDRGYVLCGHLHPAWVVRTGRQRARVPVFWLGLRHGVLPAFGGLTGGMVVTPSSGDALFAALPDAVIQVLGPGTTLS